MHEHTLVLQYALASNRTHRKSKRKDIVIPQNTMQQFGTQFFGSFLFSALLPPRDPNEKSFYSILGVDSNAKDDEIRKAYRKKSLKLHPDKIAQRGGNLSKKEEAAAEYEKVQEAYNVLINEKKRLKYDALGSPTRYRFIEQDAMANPEVLLENLAQASSVDRSRLVGFLFLVILLLLSQPILIAAKVNQSLNSQGDLQSTSWFAILVPYWIIGGLLIVLTFVVSFFVPNEDRLPICLTGLEQFFWYIGFIFLCLSWDGTWSDSVPYRQIFIPVYIAMILRWSRSILILLKVRHDIQRMVTVEYLENNLLEGKSLDELSEEEITELREAFLVVSVDPNFVQQAADLSEKEIEEEKVESSPEFESATDMYNTTFVGLACSFIFGCIFFILLTLKLDNSLNASWWIVFIPIWIERGCRLISNCYHCICGTVTGDEVVLIASNLYTEDADSIGKNSIDDKSVDQDTQQKEDRKESIDKENDDTVSTIETNVLNAKAEDNNNMNKDNDKCEQNDELAQLDDNASIKDKAEHDIPTDEKTDKGNTSDDHIDIDEEDYFAWQSAYEQAEQDANKEKAQFISEGCFLIFQIILLCLVVAKIEKNYNKMNPNDTGFNVFWILFPFFLLFGLICCCCTLLIFGAKKHSGEESEDEKEYDSENPPLKSQDNHDNEGEIDTAELEDNAANDKYCSGETEKMKMEKSELVVELAPAESNMDDLD